MRLARLHVVGVLAGLLAFAGCGGGSDETKAPAATTTAAATTTPAAAPPKRNPNLAKAIYPRCGVSRFSKPHASPMVADTAQYWRIVYQTPVTAPRVKGIPTQLTLVEQAPVGPRGSLNGAREVVVAGHKVSLRRARPKTPSNVARWQTSQARYTLLQDGSLAAVKRIIACLP
jgi:hypothetical protein